MVWNFLIYIVRDNTTNRAMERRRALPISNILLVAITIVIQMFYVFWCFQPVVNLLTNLFE